MSLVPRIEIISKIAFLYTIIITEAGKKETLTHLGTKYGASVSSNSLFIGILHAKSWDGLAVLYVTRGVTPINKLGKASIHSLALEYAFVKQWQWIFQFLGIICEKK
jgi:hypothetical protein